MLPEVVAALMAPTTGAARSVNMSTHALVSGSRNLALESRRLVVGDLAALPVGDAGVPGVGIADVERCRGAGAALCAGEVADRQQQVAAQAVQLGLVPALASGDPPQRLVERGQRALRLAG